LSIGAFGHTNNKHWIANLEPSVMSKTNNWLERCSLELFLAILLGFAMWKGLICLCLSTKNHCLFCLLSFIGMWCNFVEVVTTMKLIHGIGLFICLFFLCLVPIGIGDGERLMDNENKSFSLKSWIPNLYPSSVLCSKLDVLLLIMINVQKPHQKEKYLGVKCYLLKCQFP
jgi:hypothetical protein